MIIQTKISTDIYNDELNSQRFSKSNFRQIIHPEVEHNGYLLNDPLYFMQIRGSACMYSAS